MFLEIKRVVEMKNNEFKNLMERNGLQVQDNFAFGNIKGYPISVRKESGSKVKLCFYLEDNPWQDIRIDVLNLAKEYKVDVYYQNGQIVWNTRLKEEEDEKLQNMWNEITLIFQDKGIKTPKRCVLCGEDQSDVYAIVGESNQPVHKECLQKEIDRVRESMQKGTYSLGILGGILGCLVGSLPCILSMILLGDAFSVLFLFIPPCIYYGYLFLHGKMNQLVFWISGAFSLASVYVIQIAVRIQYYLYEEHLSVNWHNIFVLFRKLMQADGIWLSMTKNAGLDFLFALVGIIINWELISRTNLRAEDNISKVIDTVNSNPTVK